MKLEINPEIVVVKRVYLDPAIKFQLSIRNDSPDRVFFLSFHGVIKVMDRIIEIIPERNFIKELNANKVIDNVDVYVTCPLQKIHEIEKIRNKGDLELSVALEFQMYNRDTTRGNNILNIYENHAYNTKTVSILEWTKILDELGYGQRRIFEIPNPKIVEDQPLDKGLELMEDAMSMLNQGQHEEAFNKCRLALDEIYPVFNSGPGATPVTFDSSFITQIDKDSTPGPKPDGTSYPNKSKYIEDLRKYIRDYSHISHHGSYKITPEDAEFAVYLCWDLVSYLSKQLAISNDQWPIN